MKLADSLEGQILEIALLAIMGCSILIGINRGLFLGIFSVVRNILIAAATMGAAPVITNYLPESVGTARTGVGYVVALLISTVLISLLSRLVKLASNAPVIGLANRIGGLLLGGVTGFLIIWLFLGLIGAFQEFGWFGALADAARGSHITMWFQGVSPLPYILDLVDFPVL